MGVEWACDAYGENPWGLCFCEPSGPCMSHLECRFRVEAERLRIWARMNELAEAGDETARWLLESFTSHKQLLNSAQADDVGDGIEPTSSEPKERPDLRDGIDLPGWGGN